MQLLHPARAGLGADGDEDHEIGLLHDGPPHLLILALHGHGAGQSMETHARPIRDARESLRKRDVVRVQIPAGGMSRVCRALRPRGILECRISARPNRRIPGRTNGENRFLDTETGCAAVGERPSDACSRLSGACRCWRTCIVVHDPCPPVAQVHADQHGRTVRRSADVASEIPQPVSRTFKIAVLSSTVAESVTSQPVGVRRGFVTRLEMTHNKRAAFAPHHDFGCDDLCCRSHVSLLPTAGVCWSTASPTRETAIRRRALTKSAARILARSGAS